MSSGKASHRCWYCCFSTGSLEVRWFFSCNPAAILATWLFPPWTRTSDSILMNVVKLVPAAWSRYFSAASNSFRSEMLCRTLQGVKQYFKTFLSRTYQIWGFKYCVYIHTTHTVSTEKQLCRINFCFRIEVLSGHQNLEQ